MPELDIDDLRRIAYTLHQHSSLQLAVALHTAIDRLEQAERERDELRAALRQAEAERDALFVRTVTVEL